MRIACASSPKETPPAAFSFNSTTSLLVDRAYKVLHPSAVFRISNQRQLAWANTATKNVTGGCDERAAGSSSRGRKETRCHWAFQLFRTGRIEGRGRSRRRITCAGGDGRV